jgi:mRNA interferase YafQ
LKISRTRRFNKDYKRIVKQGKDVDSLREVIATLAAGKQLADKYQDHRLQGKWNKYRDCHITGDWLLIYRVKQDTLFLVRTGSHADLFK